MMGLLDDLAISPNGGHVSLSAPYRFVGARCRITLIVAASIFLLGSYLYYDYWYEDSAETFYKDPARQFKYGSTGGERLAGIPYGIFKALPVLCRDYLPRRADGGPGQGWESLGFIYEPGMDRPIGTSLRRSFGFERVALNCAACHTGTWRDDSNGESHIVLECQRKASISSH